LSGSTRWTGVSIKDAALFCSPQNISPLEGTLWRVVSEAIEERRKTSEYLCGWLGRGKTARLNKHAAVPNEDFSRLDRGQVVMTGRLGMKSPKNWRVEAETPVQILTGKRT
jgi:hypothetical protein